MTSILVEKGARRKSKGQGREHHSPSGIEKQKLSGCKVSDQEGCGLYMANKAQTTSAQIDVEKGLEEVLELMV